jgi:hypothetical protein
LPITEYPLSSKVPVMTSSFRHSQMKLSMGLLATALVAGALSACATSSGNPDLGSSEPPVVGFGTGAPDSDAAADSSTGTTDPPATGDAGPAYTYGEWSAFGVCSVTCGNGTQARTRECKRRDGVAVNCSLCGGMCTDTKPCSVSGCCGPREMCCPVTPYNVCGGDTLAACTTIIAKYAAACAAAGCMWTGATACTPGGSVSNATLPGAMGTCQ